MVGNWTLNMIVDPSKPTINEDQPNMRPMSPAKQNTILAEFETVDHDSMAFMSLQNNRSFIFPHGLDGADNKTKAKFERQDLSQ